MSNPNDTKTMRSLTEAANKINNPFATTQFAMIEMSAMEHANKAMEHARTWYKTADELYEKASSVPSRNAADHAVKAAYKAHAQAAFAAYQSLDKASEAFLVAHNKRMKP